MLAFHERGRNIKTGAASMEMIMEAPLKIKNRSTTRSSNPIPGNMFEGEEITVSKRCLLPQDHRSMISSLQGMGTT